MRRLQYDLAQSSMVIQRMRNYSKGKYLSSTHFFFFSSRRRHTRLQDDWSSDVCSSDLFQHDRRARRLGELEPFLHGAYDRGQVDRKSVVQGKSVDLGGRRLIKKKKKTGSRRGDRGPRSYRSLRGHAPDLLAA